MEFIEIINKLNESNSSKYKLDVLTQFKNDATLRRVLKLTYDRVAYNFWIRKIPSYTPGPVMLSILDGLNFLENILAKRVVTGNEAIGQLSSLLASLPLNDATVIERIIGRDLKINVGRTSINKVFKDLITKPVYMRCDVYSDKTAKNITFPAISQLKADGTYREFNVANGTVESRSRSGETYDYPLINECLSTFPDGIYCGELLVEGIADRGEGNGLINSDAPPHDKIYLQTWDFVTHEEYMNAANRVPNKTPYAKRFTQLKANGTFSKRVQLIESHEVANLSEALQLTSQWMTDGYEGSILKDTNGVFRDGTSKHQLKLKIKIDCEMRIVGYKPGTAGTKREGKVGGILFENDEGTIKGSTSGFDDKTLDMITENQDKFLRMIMTVQFNDLTKARGNDYYALSHPRFVEIRYDKNETDTLEKVMALRDMAMQLSK